MKRILVLGAGIAGITAAYEVSKIPDSEVTLIEQSGDIGGMLQAITINGEYMDIFYHHVFERDKHFLEMVKTIGAGGKIVWKEASTSFFNEGKFYRLSAPQDALFFPLLSLGQRVKLIRFMLKIGKIKDPRKYDGTPAGEWIRQNVGEDVFQKFFRPMLRSKFGSDENNVSAAWLIDRINLRGKRDLRGERLGYYNGGFRKFLEDVIEKLGKNFTLKLKHNVKKLVIEGDVVTGFEDSEGIHPVDAVISTIPINVLSQMIKHEFSETLASFRYQGAVCMIVGTRKPVTKYYWTNIMDNSPIGAIVEHTNFQPARDYGMHLCYLASYPPENSKIWEMSNEQIKELYLGEFAKLTGVKKEDVIFSHVSKTTAAGMVYQVGILSKLLPEKTPVRNLFIGGMFNSYPDRSINMSIQKGAKCAELASEYLGD